MKKNLNFAQTALLNEIKVYNDEMRWDSYYFEGYQHDAEPHTLEEAGEAYLDDKDFMKLLNSLNLCRATSYKYRSIVQHEYTEQLLETDQLPKKWTVLEQILKLNKDDFKKIKKDINFNTSAKEFKAMINITPKISNNRQPLSMTTTCMNKQVYKYLSKKIEVLIKETNDHFKIANSAVLKLPTQKVSI